VFRNPPQGYHGRQLEFYQAGVELLFVNGILADAEILLLLADCLNTLGIKEWQLLLGDAGLTRSLLKIFPESLRYQILNSIANLDRVTLEKLDLEKDLKIIALQLFDLRGNALDVLEKVSQFNLSETEKNAVNHLQSLINLVDNSSSQKLSIILDLSLVQTFDYYTGIVFEAVGFSNNKPHILGQGGRYNQLLGIYHPQRKTYPGIGFSLNIEDLHTCLLDTPNLPKTNPPSDWLVIPETPSAVEKAFAYAQILRHSDNIVRVELDLQSRNREEILKYAQQENIIHLAWISEEGNPTTEVINIGIT
jgi:ATP phosphoribosyltransferase regulatory subunit